MGLPMDDIHVPTVPSGDVSGRATANEALMEKLSLGDILAEKDRVENELVTLSDVLDSVSHSEPLPQ